jgi:UDP-N-acetylmuramyl pentapeptide phosphotransferase/UDP-N-acetylglucosamine-1-phosphate transferase
VTYRTLGASVLTGAAAAVLARLAYRALTRFPPGGEKAWSRVNHRGEPVTLLEGPAAVAGAIAASALGSAALSAAGGRLPGPSQPGRAVPDRLPLALCAAGLGGGAFGVLDDLKGSGKRRGLRGHLGALRDGEVTTGAVKLAGLAATGAVGAALLRHEGGRVDYAVNAGLIAGGANLLNLFDLRPGRAIKVGALSAALISSAAAVAGRPAHGVAAVAAPVGAALAVLPEDLGERAMLGDAGANSLGAMLGAAAAATLPRPARIGLLTGIIALTALSEKVSFTKVIARTPALNWLDMLGRRAPASRPPST